jgi:hypothetical protein
MNELQEFQGLLQELLQAIQLSMQSGEALPDELQGQIAQTLEMLFNRIEELMGQEAGEIPNIPQAEPELQQSGPSSNIESFGYDDKTGRLLVRFLGQHPNRNGPVYGYQNVPKQIFELFRQGAVPARTDGKNKWGKWWKGKVPSLGASMFTLIKGGGYPYQRLS